MLSTETSIKLYYLNYIAHYLDIAAPLIILLIVIFRLKKFEFLDWMIFTFLVIQTILNTIATYIELNPGPNGNHLVYYINSILSLLILSCFYRHIFINSKVYKNIVVCIFVLFALAVAFILGVLKSMLNYTSYTLAVNALVIVVYSLVALWKLLEMQQDLPLYQTKEFYFIMGLLTYYGISFIIFLVHNYLTSLLPLQVNYLWMYHNFFFAIACGIWLKAFFINDGYKNNNSNNNSSFRI